ncbi:MAG: sulfatase-like hydrolase/transferase [Mariniblastus sp.]|nr:sulfatase-like hydrolase/transferase [Mariniblastus sp.]
MNLRSIIVSMLAFLACVLGENASARTVQTATQPNIVLFFIDDMGWKDWSGGGSYYERGIRVPFLVRWPDKIKPSVNNMPVVAIDLYPTMLELAGVEDFAAHLDGYEFDGESLVPTLLGEGDLKERALFWHFPAYLDGNPKYTKTRSYPAYRQQPVSVIGRGDWKLLMHLEEWSLDGGRESIATNNARKLYNLRREREQKPRTRRNGRPRPVA